MQFSTTARGKLKRLATRRLEQTIRVAGQEMTPRILIRSTGSPNCAILVRGPAMVLEGRSTEMCLFTNWPEVRPDVQEINSRRPHSCHPFCKSRLLKP